MLAEPIAWFPKEVASQLASILPSSGGEEKAASSRSFGDDREKSQLEGVAQKIAKQGYMTKIRWA